MPGFLRKTVIFLAFVFCVIFAAPGAYAACCDAGYYGSGDKSCTACPAPFNNSDNVGKVCPNTTINSCYLTLSSGYYYNGKSGAVEVCPTGYTCPGGATVYYGEVGQIGRTANCNLINRDKNPPAGMGSSVIPLLYKKTGSTSWYSDDTCTTQQTTPTNIPTYSGYVCTGFYTEESGGTRVIDQNGNLLSWSVSQPTYIYAQWINPIVTVSLNNQSATTAGSTAVYERYNTGIYLDAAATSQQMTTSTNHITLPTRTGYTFGGYYTGTNGTGTQLINASGYITNSFTTTRFTAGTTIYAKWSPNTYTVTFKSGDITIGTQTFTYGTAQNLTDLADLSNVSALPEYLLRTTSGDTNLWKFKGWTTNNNSTGTSYANGTSVNNLSSTNGGVVTLYGVWQRTLSYRRFSSATATNWTTGAGTQYYKGNTSVSNLSLPALVAHTTYGWNPVGWVTNASSTTPDIAQTTAVTLTPAANTTIPTYYYALYNRTITLSYDANGGSGTVNNQTAVQHLSYGANGQHTISFTLANASGLTAPTGYSFSKWAPGSVNGTPQYDAGASFYFPNKTLSSDSTYTMYAIWTPNTITLDWNENGGGAITDGSCDYDDDLILPAAPTRPGYTFTGWKLANNTTQSAGATITGGCTSTYTGVTSGTSTAIQAQWTPNCNAITLDNTTRGGSTANATLYKYTDNPAWYSSKTNATTCATAVTTVAAPSKTHATFSGYYLSPTNTTTNVASSASPSVLNTTWTVNAPTTIYAHYNCDEYYDDGGLDIAGACNPDQCQITLNNADATTNGTTTLYTTYGVGVYLDSARTQSMTTSSNPITTPSRVGYSFDGYFGLAKERPQYILSSGLLNSNGYNAATSGRYCSTWDTGWTPNTITLNWDENGGGAITDGSCDYDGDLVLPSAPTRTGYTFTGWKLANNTTQSAGATVNGGCTLTYTGVTSGTSTAIQAQWSAQSSTVTLNSNGGTAGSVTSVTATYDAAMPTISGNGALPTRPGYTFDGYGDTTTGGIKYYNADGTSAHTWDKTGNQILYAIWRANCNEITINVSANGGTLNGDAESVTLYKYTDGDYWSTHSLCRPRDTITTLTDFGLGGLPTKTNATYSGTYENQGTPTGAQVIAADGTLNNSWNTTQNTTIYAHYNCNTGYSANNDGTACVANTYTISYAGMDGATHGSSHPITGTYDTEFTVNNPTKPGYTFAGWDISGMDSVTHYYGASSATSTSSATSLGHATITPSIIKFKNLRATSGTVTFTAVWTPNVIASASDKQLTYNGSAQSCANVTVTTPASGYTIKYSNAANGTFTTTVPTMTNVSESPKTIYYQVSAPNHITATGSYSCSMVNAADVVTIMDGSTNVTNSGGATTFPNNKVLTASCASGATPTLSNTGTASVATTTISNGTITMVPVAAGATTSTITVKCAAASNYNPATATYTLTVNKGTITHTPATLPGNSKVYDTQSLSCTGGITGRTPSNATMQYAEKTGNSCSGVSYSSTVPSRTNVGTTTVCYKLSAANYNDKLGEYSCTVTQASGSTKIKDGDTYVTNGSGSVVYPSTKSLTAICAGGATISSVTSGTTSVATVSNSGNNITITPVAAGATTSTITVNCPATTNYAASSATYTITVNKGTCTVSLSAASGSTTYPTTKQITASSNSGGTLSVASSAESVATAAISNGTVTMTPVAQGNATITVTSAATSNYNSCSASYALTVNRGTCTMTLTPTSGTVTYPGTTTTFNIDKGASNGAVSTSLSNNTSSATVALSSNDTVGTVTYGTSGGVTVTVTAAQTNQYNSCSATYNGTAADKIITLKKNGGTGTCGGATGVNDGTLACTLGGTCTAPSWNSNTCNITNGAKVFDGWATSASGAVAYAPGANLNNAPTTLYAHWSDVTCNITNGTGTATTPSNNAPRCAVTCNSNYHTSGTYTGTGTTVSYTCEPDTYTVTYACGTGATGNPPANATATYNAAFTPAANNTCVKAGYTFAGWNDGTTDRTPGTAFTWTYTTGKTFTAIWTANTNTAYKVYHYTKNLGATTYTQNGNVDNLTGTSDATLTLANLKRTITGFTYSEGFAGTAATGTTKPTSGAVTTTTILADGTRVISLYYNRDTHTVTLAKGACSAVSGGGTYEYGANVSISATPGTGYDWVKWTQTSGGAQVSTANPYAFTMGTSNLSYTANCTPSTYTITYTMNGGDNYTNAPTSYTYGTGATINGTPTRANSTFTGWTGSNGNTPQTTVTISTTATGNKSYTANWTCNAGYSASGNTCVANNYTITLDNANATTNGTATLYTTHDTDVYLNSARTQVMSESANPITLPLRRGYRFVGYKCPAEGGEQPWELICIDEDGHLTSSGRTHGIGYSDSTKTWNVAWGANVYTVTLNKNNGTGGSNAVYEYFDNAWYNNDPSAMGTHHTITSVESLPTRANYTFRGYYTEQVADVDATGNTGTQEITKSGVLPANNTYDANTTLYAGWARNCAATAPATCTMTVAENGAVTYTTACPDNTGYTLNNAGKYNPSCTAATSNVTFNKNASDAVAGTPQSVTATYGSAMPTPVTSPTRPGYTFMGYYDTPNATGGTQYYGGYEGNGSGNIQSAHVWDKVGDQTLYARWAAKCNKITFDGTTNGGTSLTGKFLYKLTDDGTAWYTSGKCSGTTVTTLRGAGITPPTKSNAMFTGFFENAGIPTGTKVVDDEMTMGALSTTWTVNGDTTLYAHYDCDEHWQGNGVDISGACDSGTQYTIYYVMNGGTNYAGAPASYTYGTGATINGTPTREHSGFGGWCTDSGLNTCTGTQTISTTDYGDKTYYAKWKCLEGYSANNDGSACVANTITLNWNENGGSAVANGSCTYDGDLILPAAPSKTGYTFVEWVLYDGTAKSAGTTVDNGCVYEKTGVYEGTSTSITARWSPNTYTIAYAGMTGATHGDNHPTSATYDEDVKVSAPSKPGYTFAGWNISGMDTTTHYHGTTSANTAFNTTTLNGTMSTKFRNLRASSGTVTFTATWSADVYTITLSDGTGTSQSGMPNPIYLKYNTGWYSNSAATTGIGALAATPIKIGYLFEGYYTGENGTGTQIINNAGTIVANNTAFVANATIYAKYTAQTGFTVTTTNLAANTTFKFAISAAGQFYVNWGDGTVTPLNRENNTTETPVSHTYATAGVKTITIYGRATGYNAGSSVAVIRFGADANAAVTGVTNTLVSGVSGSLATVFPTISGTQPKFVRTFGTCTNLTGAIPAGLFSGLSGAPVADMFLGTFEMDTGLTGTIPTGLFSAVSGAVQTGTFKDTFKGCANLTGYVPRGLFATFSGGNVANTHTDMFVDSGLASECPCGMTQYTTGFENADGKINTKVSCQLGTKIGEYWHNGHCVTECESGITRLRTSNGVDVPLLRAKVGIKNVAFKHNNKVCYSPVETGNLSGHVNLKQGATTYHISEPDGIEPDGFRNLPDGVLPAPGYTVE